MSAPGVFLSPPATNYARRFFPFSVLWSSRGMNVKRLVAVAVTAILALVAYDVWAIAPLVFGQVEAPTAPAAPGNWIVNLIPLIVPIIVAGIKLALPRLPKAWLPVVAVGLGAGLDLVSHWTTGSASSPLLGAIMGAAGVGIREILDQVKKLNNPTA